jgi:hypothetical protein
MDGDFWVRCTLGAKLHKFLSTIDSDQIREEQIAGDEWSWQKASFNLKRFTELITDDPRADEFRQSLGFQQLASWTLLQEWFGALYQPSHLSEAARRAIDSGTYRPSGLMDVYPKFPLSALINESSYHYWLSELYIAEFMPSSLLWKPENGSEALGLIDNSRRRASDFASCQKVAHTFYMSQKETCEHTKPKYEHRPSLMKEVCPWLIREAMTNERPYYLWHVTQRRGVIVHQLNEAPEYTCISHTWGRWRTDKMLTVEGIPWWRVPENIVFNVTDLPQLLSRCRGRLTTEYIWLDLLCIPQESKDSELAELARREILRQALIFRNAAACIAWLSYAEHWEAEQATLNWLSLAYLRLSTSPQIYQVEQSLGPAEKSAEKPLQLLKHPFHNRYLGPGEFPLSGLGDDILRLNFFRSRSRPQDWVKPSAWFSSLWTLQEAYFRPDMVLMNRKWEALSDAAGNLITLEMLSAFVGTMQGLLRDWEFDTGAPRPGLQDERTPKHENMPLGPSQLFNLAADVQILSRSHPSRAQILVQGNTRQCTGRRAEAIMSVLGVTDWLSSTSDQHQQDLVLGMYPLAFIREAIQKIGPDFFLARKMIGSPWLSLNYLFGPARGSMLPFDILDHKRLRGKKDVSMYPFQAYDSRFHSAVSTWTLEQSGVFRIRQAGVLGSSDGTFQIVAPVRVLLTYQPAPGKYINKDRVHLKQWLESRPKMYRTYAVNISRDLGLILQGFRFGPSQPRRLIKIGCYEVWDTDEDDHCPPTTDWLQAQPVDWVPTRTVEWVVQ